MKDLACQERRGTWEQWMQKPTCSDWRMSTWLMRLQWRLSHHLIPAAAAAHCLLRHTYELRHLHTVLLTLPISTASVEHGFSKLALQKDNLMKLDDA